MPREGESRADNVNLFQSFGTVIAIDNGNVAFLSGEGIYTDLGAGLQAVANTTTAVPDRSGDNFTGFETPGIDDDMIAFRGFFQQNQQQGLYQWSNGVIRTIVDGSSLGFGDIGSISAITPSVAVEFDTHANSFDPNDNHVGIIINGNVDNHLSVGNPSFTLNNGELHHVWIDYDAGHEVLRTCPEIESRYQSSCGMAV